MISEMLTLSVRDFAINTEHVFARAIPFEQASFTAFSEAMLKSFGVVLVAKDISLESGDRLFNYRLVCRMFSGAVDVTLTSAGVTTAFRNGQNKKALGLIADSILLIETILQSFPLSFRRLTYAAHAEFDTREDYDAHMQGIIGKRGGYSAAGIVLHSKENPFDGELRFSTDRSLVHEKALFVACEYLINEVFSKDTLAKLVERFAVVAKDAQIELVTPE